MRALPPLSDPAPPSAVILNIDQTEDPTVQVCVRMRVALRSAAGACSMHATRPAPDVLRRR